MPVVPLALDSTNHWLVPFASLAGAPHPPDLPHLDALTALLVETRRDADDATSLNPPHERVLALLRGMAATDGALPWAAIDSDEPEVPQAWVHPVHLQVGMDQVSLLTAEQASLDETASMALFKALEPLCQEDGVSLAFDSAHRWRARGERLQHLACASLDRVAGRSVAAWMPRGAQARWLQRLQSEAQMLFYTHPVNDAREAVRQLPINGVWFSAPGALPPGTRLQAPPVVVQTLRAPALASDGAAWQQAWSALDATLLHELLLRARRGEAIALTLCGERSALTLQTCTPTPAQRLRRWLGLQHTPRAHDLLNTL